MLKDYIDCKNDATSKFLTDALESSTMSNEVPSEPPVVEQVTTVTVDDVYEIECSSVAEEIIIEDEKCFDSSSPDSIIEIIDNDSVEELQSPIADEVDQLINNEHINSKHALKNNEYDQFLDRDLPNNEPISTNDLMEIDTPFLNGNSSQNIEDVKITSEDPVEKILNGDPSPQNANDVEIVPTDTVEKVAVSSNPVENFTEPPTNERPITTEVTDKPYKCHICGKLFSRNSSLKCHIRLHVEGPDSLLRGTSEPASFKFNYIDLNTKKEDTKKEEVESAVEPITSELVPCDEPTTCVPNSSRESGDLAEDDDKREYKCIICEKTFSRKSSLTFHYKFHPKSPTSKSQEDISAIAGESIHDETPMEVDPLAVADQFKCDKCDRTFPQKNTYLWHLKMHETNVRRKSSDNNAAVNQTNGVKDSLVHTSDHADDEMSTDVASEADSNFYKCHLCPRSFPQLRGLKTHSGVHKRKPTDDQVPETLNQIVYEEVSSRKYSCCKKLHIHDDVTKLFKCNVCCKCFCDIANLKRHLARNHQKEDTSEASDNDVVVAASRKKSISIESRPSRKPANTRPDDSSDILRGLYKCGVCDKAFDEIHLLADHVSVHIQAQSDSVQNTTDESGAEELCCVVCEKTFRNQNSLSRHMNEHRRREEEILVRVTSSGRKIRERRPSEDLSTISPIKCIPCNRYFESMRAKHIHDSSKHPAEQVEPEESESVDDEVEDNNEEFVCECCNKSWASVRSLAIHKSWSGIRKQSLAPANETAAESVSIDDEEGEVEEEETDSYEPDDSAHTEENKTENDVTSSVKCGCCNELFPNIPALNAHLSGQTNGTVIDGTSSTPDYENDPMRFDSLRNLVKCDRCDKFCSSIPALKLHIMSDHTKKTVPQSSTDGANSQQCQTIPEPKSDRKKNSLESSSVPASKPVTAERKKSSIESSIVPASKPVTASERKKSSIESSSVPASKPVTASDRKKNSIENSSIPTPKPVTASDRKKSSTEISSGPVSKSVTASDRKRSSTETSNVPAIKSNIASSSASVSKPQISSDRPKRSRSSTDSWISPAKKSYFVSDRTRKSVAQSPAESSIVEKSNTVSDRKKKPVSQSSTEVFTATLKANISDESKKPATRSTKNFNADSKANVHDEPEKSVAQNSAEDSNKSNISDQSEKTTFASSVEDPSVPAPKSASENTIIAAVESNEISNQVEKSALQNAAESSNILAGSRDISDQAAKSTAQDSAEISTIPAADPPVISDQGAKSTAQDSAEISSIPAAGSSDISGQAAESTAQDSAEVQNGPAPISDIISNAEKSAARVENPTPESKSDSPPIESIIAPAAESRDVSNQAEKSVMQNLTENSSVPDAESCDTSDQTEKSNHQDSIEKSKPLLTEISSGAASKSDVTDPTIEPLPEISTEPSNTSTSQSEVTANDTEKQIPSAAATDDVTRTEPPIEEKPTKPAPVVIIAQSVLRRRSLGLGDKRREQNSRDSSNDSNRTSASFESVKDSRASTSIKPSPAIEPAKNSNRASTSLKPTPAIEPAINSNRASTSFESAKDSNRASTSSKPTPAIEPVKNSSRASTSLKSTPDVKSASDSAVDTATFACCDRIFGSSRALKLHQRCHPPITNVASALTATPTNVPDTPDDTEIGDAVNSNASYLSTDHDSDDGVFRDFQCSICNKRFSQDKYLRYHRAKHFEPGEIDPEQERMPFACSKCDKKFEKESSLRVHKAYHTTLENKAPIDHGNYSDMRNGFFKCNECDREFEHVRGVAIHYSAAHKKKYPCSECDKFFNVFEELADHFKDVHKRKRTEMYTELKNGVYQCNGCDRQFDGHRGASKHYAFAHVEHSEESYPCSQCDRVFNCSQGLAGHTWGAHKRERAIAATTDDDEDEEEFKCKRCDKVYANARGLRRHCASFHNENTDDEEAEDFSCDRCDKSFSNASSLKKHSGGCKKVADEIRESKWCCELCHKSFANKCNLKRHRRDVHHIPDGNETEDEGQTTDAEPDKPSQREESYPCSECDRVFTSYRGLNGHMHKHQQYVCPNCNETCSNVRNFNAHMEKCELKAPELEENLLDEFQCDQCHRKFPSARSLGGHKRMHYVDSEPEDVDEQPETETESDADADNESEDQPNEFQCTQCDRSFGNSRSLSVHVNTHYSQENPLELPCPQCDRVFGSYRSLSMHYIFHRGDNDKTEFPCPKCKSSFTSTRALCEHFGETHKKTTARRSNRFDSKAGSSQHRETRSQSRNHPEDVAEPSADPENHPCNKCGLEFASERALTGHRRKCIPRSKSVEEPISPRSIKTRSKSVGDRSSTRGDSTPVESAQNEDVAEPTSSGVRKSRRLQSFAADASQQHQKGEQMDVDGQDEAQSSVPNDQIEEPDNAPKPICDICELTFPDLKSLAEHLASHEIACTGSMNKRYESSEMQIRLHNCTQCDQIFTNRVSLRKHSLTHSEPIAVPWEQPPLNLQCPLCPKIIPTTLGFKRHMYTHKNTPANADHSAVESQSSKVTVPEDDSNGEVRAEKSPDQEPVENADRLTNGVDDPTDEPVEKSSDDTNLAAEKESINDTNSAAEKESDLTAAKEPINDPIPPPESEKLIPAFQDDSINRPKESLKNTASSSCDSQSDQSTCDEEPNTSRSSLPIVSDEPIACLSCKICSRQFNRVKAFNKHVQWHKFNDDAVDGEETAGTGDDPKQRITNGALTNGNTPAGDLLAYVKCDICAEIFKKADILKKHASDVHNVTITSPILYHCGSCEKAFSRGNALFVHLKSHVTKDQSEDAMPFECASCEKCFKIKDDLLEHVKTHLNDAEIETETNDVETETQHTGVETESHLNGSTDEIPHLNGTNENIELKIPSDHSDDDQTEQPAETHHQSKRPKLSFDCSKCDKTFSRKCHMMTHYRAHRKKSPVDSTSRTTKIISPPKEHQCTQCDKSFRLKTTLAVHEQKHSGDKSLRKSLKRSNDDSYTAEDGVRSSKRSHKDIS